MVLFRIQSEKIDNPTELSCLGLGFLFVLLCLCGFFTQYLQGVGHLFQIFTGLSLRIKI